MTSDESPQQSSDGQHGDDGSSGWASAGVAGAIGFQFVGFIAVAILLGHWIDQKLGTEPVALLVGMLVAIVAGSVHTYRMANRLMGSDDDT